MAFYKNRKLIQPNQTVVYQGKTYTPHKMVDITPSRYVLAKDTDFEEIGPMNYRYVGAEEYIIIPQRYTINPRYLFRGNDTVKGVSFETPHNVKSTTELFYQCQSPTLELKYMDTSNVTDMSIMFFGSQAQELDLSSFNTSSVTNMHGMFYYSQAQELDLSSFDTSNVTDMTGMFNRSQATKVYVNEQTFNKFMDNLTAISKPHTLIFYNKATDEPWLNELEIEYMNYAADIFYRGGHQSLFADAWEHSLAVDTAEISANSSTSNKRGTAQYPNGETEGVIIPQGVTSIGNYAFYYWTSNNQPLVIPNSVTSIGDWAFAYWNSNNQPLVIPNSVTSIGDWAFVYWTSNNQPLVIPDSVESIGNQAFMSWTSNNQPLVIPDSVTSIGSSAFHGWETNNQPLVIPDSVTSIGDYAFQRWTSNNQPLVIPNSVTSIGSNTFNNWQLVPYVEIQRTTPPTLVNINAFDGQNDAPIYVPDESVDAYKAATQWVSLADRIFSINDK